MTLVFIIMLIELLCPKCKGPLDMDDDMKVGVCPFCGTKALLTESIPNKLNIQLPEINSQRSKQLAQYSYRMLVQGNKGVAFDSADEALRLDPDNVDAWLLYSVLTKKPLKSEIVEKLELINGLHMAKDLLGLDVAYSVQIYQLFPELSPKNNVPVDINRQWSVINGGSFFELIIEYSCNKRKDHLVHYYNWHKDDLSLVQGMNDLKLESGIHVFVNIKTKKYLIIAVPEIEKGTPLYYSSSSDSLFKSKGAHKFSKWSSDSDTIIVNAFVINESTGEKLEIDCNGMQPYVNPLLQ